MYSTVISASVGTQLKTLNCLPGCVDHCHNGPFQMLIFIFVFVLQVIKFNLVRCSEASGSQLCDI